MNFYIESNIMLYNQISFAIYDSLSLRRCGSFTLSPDG